MASDITNLDNLCELDAYAPLAPVLCLLGEVDVVGVWHSRELGRGGRGKQHGGQHYRGQQRDHSGREGSPAPHLLLAAPGSVGSEKPLDKDDDKAKIQGVFSMEDSRDLWFFESGIDFANRPSKFHSKLEIAGKG